MLWATCTIGKIKCPFMKFLMMELKWFSLKRLRSAVNERVTNIALCWVLRKTTILQIWVCHKLNIVHLFSKVFIIFDTVSDCLSFCNKTWNMSY